MGWFIAQSLAFIIIAAIIGLAIGIWIGWLVWGRRSKGKHAAEKAEAAARLAAAESASKAESTTETKAEAGSETDAKSGTAETGEAETGEAEQADAEPAPAVAVAAGATTAVATDEANESDAETSDTRTAVGTDTVLPVADSPSSSDADADAASTDEDDDEDATATDGRGAAEVAAAKSAVVAEAEAVARKAAEADAAKAEAEAENDATTDVAGTDEAGVEAPAVEPPAAETPAAETPDNLRRIEGIGPKIASALAAAGYPTYAKIAAATEDELREAVATQGIKFAPSAATWADQAKYLADGDEDGLKEFQDYLVGGQERRAKFKETVDYTDVDEIEGTEAKAEAIAEDEAAAAAAPEPAPAAAVEPEPEPQDLRRIEGIGPKIEATLQAAGYATYAKVAGASETELREALATGGIKFAPAAASWAEQAQLLADGDEDGLKEFQDYLIGGQDRAAKFRESVDYTDVDEIEGAEAKAEAIAEDEAKAASADDDAEPTTGSAVKA